MVEPTTEAFNWWQFAETWAPIALSIIAFVFALFSWTQTKSADRRALAHIANQRMISTIARADKTSQSLQEMLREINNVNGLAAFRSSTHFKDLSTLDLLQRGVKQHLETLKGMQLCTSQYSHAEIQAREIELSVIEANCSVTEARLEMLATQQSSYSV